MPEAIAAIGAGSWWTTVGYAGITYGGYVMLAVAAYTAYDTNRAARAAKQRARDSYNASLEDRLTMLSTVSGARSRVYGRVRNVDGVVFKGTWGDKSQFYTLVVALAGHECDAIEDVFFNDQRLELLSDGEGKGGYWVNTAPFFRDDVKSATEAMPPAGFDGVTTFTTSHLPMTVGLYSVDDLGIQSPHATFTVEGNVVRATGVPPGLVLYCSYQYQNAQPKARIWKYLGAPGQDIGTDLLKERFPTLINVDGNTDRFAGMCCVVVELEYDPDSFPAGPPQVSAILLGAKVYDPRTGITAFSSNPALIARDWALYSNGGGCSPDEINDEAVIAAANACDVPTVFTVRVNT